jgi:hypothetical protein
MLNSIYARPALTARPQPAPRSTRVTLPFEDLVHSFDTSPLARPRTCYLAAYDQVRVNHPPANPTLASDTNSPPHHYAYLWRG